MKAVIVIGSNWGDSRAIIDSTLSHLAKLSSILRTSSIYETPDFFGGGGKYLNMVIEIETNIREEDFNADLKEFEIVSGRDEKARQRGEVPIDIDVVIWNNEIRRRADFNSTYFKKGYSEILSIS